MNGILKKMSKMNKIIRKTNTKDNRATSTENSNELWYSKSFKVLLLFII